MPSRPPNRSVRLDLDSPDTTGSCAAALATTLSPGDTLLLSGPVGAGKTHFARALIQSVLRVPEDVPSPTYTLVQTYDTRVGTIWHADLYRLASVQEIEELGLLEAFDTAICLVEWPDRLGALAPSTALSLTFSDGTQPDARHLDVAWQDGRWDALREIWPA